MLIAPASAATLAKMVTGVADNMLLTTYLSMKAPVWVAPAMDLDMYRHPATQSNLQTLRERGVHVVEPGDGFLASGLEGKGRMEEPEQIAQAVADLFEAKEPGCKEPSLAGIEVLITAGPTYEPIDAARSSRGACGESINGLRDASRLPKSFKLMPPCHFFRCCGGLSPRA